MAARTALYIPSRGRWAEMRTLLALPASWQRHTVLVVYETEAEQYRAAAASINPSIEVWPVPLTPAGIAGKRQRIVQRAAASGATHCMQLDDDLAFYTRIDSPIAGTVRFIPATPPEVGAGLDWMWQRAHSGYAWAGLGHKFMADKRSHVYENSNPAHAWIVGIEAMHQADLRFDDIQLCEDWHVCLGLLEHGHPNVYTSRLVVQGSKPNKLGGCKAYRTPELVRQAQHDFVRLHPFTSKLVPTDALQQGCDVGEGLRVQWKRALDSRVSSNLPPLLRS